jgi:hypothetical protein
MKEETMKHIRNVIVAAAVCLLCFTVNANAQFAGTGTTTLSLTVASEASLHIDSPTTTLATVGTVFANYTGTTSFTYKIRTTKTGGSGTLTAALTAPFGAGGPVLGAGSTDLQFTCSVSLPATGCTSAQPVTTAAAGTVATFGTNAHSARAGNSGSVVWALVNDPVYETDSYTATVTFTVSAT